MVATATSGVKIPVTDGAGDAVKDGVAVPASSPGLEADIVNAARVFATVVPTKSGVEMPPAGMLQARLVNIRIKPPVTIRQK